MNCYKRDYDLLGYKYALMSQLATAGMNNVLCMIPVRRAIDELNIYSKKSILQVGGLNLHAASMSCTRPGAYPYVYRLTGSG